MTINYTVTSTDSVISFVISAILFSLVLLLLDKLKKKDNKNG